MKTSFLIIYLFLIAYPVFSQGESAVFLSAGANKMSGDIGGDNLKSLFKSNLGFGSSVGFRYVFPSNFGFRLFGGYEDYRGKDTQKSNDERTHFFSGDVTKIGTNLEYVIYGNRFIDKQISHSLYAFGGIVAVFYNSLFDNDVKIKGSTAGLSIGAAYQYRLSEKFSVGVEVTQTMFLTDKMDGYFPDISSNKNKDTAFDVKVVLSYYIPFSIKTGGKWEIMDN
ncbi:MAG: hypothetical protein QM751_12075 [Paludibacteraceae bacterium]